MLKFLPLLLANLRRKPLRSALTFASIVIAFLLFGLLQTMRAALSGGADFAGVDRLMTAHKVSIIQSLPLSYVNRIRGVDGVLAVCSQDWFGGIYQNDRNQIAAFPVRVETFFDVFRDYSAPSEQRDAWLRDRRSALVGKTLAQRFGWQIGDTIPLRSNVWTRTDGAAAWELKIVGFYESEADTNSLYFHYEYFNEARSFGRDTVGWVTTRIADPDRAADIAQRIDTLFRNSATETKTATEKAMVQGFANQMGNIGALVSAVAAAVFFTMLLVTANTMAQSVRERTNELAVMKTLGFSAATVTWLVLAETLLMTVAGGAVGLAIAAISAKALASVLSQFLPFVGLPSDTFGVGLVLMIALGVLAAALPCAQAWRLKIVDALRTA